MGVSREKHPLLFKKGRGIFSRVSLFSRLRYLKAYTHWMRSGDETTITQEFTSVALYPHQFYIGTRLVKCSLPSNFSSLAI